MHLCIVLGLRFQPPGGAERVVAEEASYFAASGHDVTVLTRDVAPAYREQFAETQVQFVEYDEGDPLLQEPWRIRRHLAAVDPDFVLSHYADEPVYLATLTHPSDLPFGVHVHGSPLWFTKPDRILPHRRSRAYDQLVAEVAGHGEFTESTEITRRRRARAEVGEALRRRALKRAAFVSTGSERVARELAWLYGVDAQLARPGVSASWADAAARADTVSLGPWDDVVLSVSRLDRRKRIDLLVRTVARLRDDHGRDAGLVICGTGDEEKRLRSAVADHDVADAVRFEGYLPDAELPTYYRSADVFACPAWMSYGLSPLEAYALSTRVVLSTDTYAKEVIGDCPGVAIAEPTVEAWASALVEQFDTDVTPEPSVVPTWASYGDRRAALVARHTLV